MNPSVWPSFLQKILQGATIAPDRCFKKASYVNGWSLALETYADSLSLALEAYSVKLILCVCFISVLEVLVFSKLRTQY